MLLEEALDSLVHIYSLQPPIGPAHAQSSFSGTSDTQRPFVGEGGAKSSEEEEVADGAGAEEAGGGRGRQRLVAEAEAEAEGASLDAARCLCGIINDPALSLRKEVGCC